MSTLILCPIGDIPSRRGPLEYARAQASLILQEYGGLCPEKVLARWIAERFKVQPDQALALATREIRLAWHGLRRWAGIRALAFTGHGFTSLDRPASDAIPVQGPMRLDWAQRQT